MATALVKVALYRVLKDVRYGVLVLEQKIPSDASEML